MSTPGGASQDAPFLSRARNVATLVIAAILVIAAAKYAAPILVPVVLGILLAYTMRPLVTLIERTGLPRVVAALLVVISLVGGLSIGAWAIADDVQAAVAELPAAARKLRALVREWQSDGPSAIKAMKEAASEIGKTAAEVAGPAPAPTGRAPAPAAPPSEESAITSALAANSLGLVTIAANLAMALLLATLILSSGDAFRRKMVRIVGPSLARRRVTVEIMNEIDTQVQRQLLVMLGINLMLALTTWLLLALLGLSRPALWGALVGLLHFIPYLGAVAGAAVVGVVALVQTGSLGATLGYAAMTVGLCIFFGMVVATLWQGRACRMNAVSTFVALLFFGWLWGAWGLLMGGPLIAVVKVVADRVEGLNALGELLGETAVPAAVSAAVDASVADRQARRSV